MPSGRAVRLIDRQRQRHEIIQILKVILTYFRYLNAIISWMKTFPPRQKAITLKGVARSSYKHLNGIGVLFD